MMNVRGCRHELLIILRPHFVVHYLNEHTQIKEMAKLGHAVSTILLIPQRNELTKSTS